MPIRREACQWKLEPEQPVARAKKCLTLIVVLPSLCDIQLLFNHAPLRCLFICPNVLTSALQTFVVDDLRNGAISHNQVSALPSRKGISEKKLDRRQQLDHIYTGWQQRSMWGVPRSSIHSCYLQRLPVVFSLSPVWVGGWVAPTGIVALVIVYFLKYPYGRSSRIAPQDGAQSPPFVVHPWYLSEGSADVRRNE